MKVLLDTHFLIWLAIEPDSLRPAESALIRRHRHQTSVSAISLWEVRMKWDKRDRDGRRKGVLDPAVAADFLDRLGFAVEPFTLDVAVAPLAAPIDHANPFDRILLVHAQQLGARLLTRDRKLAAHPLSLPL